MIITEIILSLVVGMWLVAIIILPTNKLTKLDDSAKLDIKRNINMGKEQGALYNTNRDGDNDDESEFDFTHVGKGIYYINDENSSIKVSEDRTYINIEDKKSYYSKGKYDKEDIDSIENKNKIYKSRKWVSANKTMESISFSKNEFETELKKYLENIEEMKGDIKFEYIKDDLKVEDKDEPSFSFNNPISKIDIESKGSNKDSADIGFVKVKEITKEIDRWKIKYKILEGRIDLKYDEETGKIQLDKNYEIYDMNERSFILYINVILRK